jgi:hypothetical protein
MNFRLNHVTAVSFIIGENLNTVWCLTLQRRGIKGINKGMNFYISDSGLYEMNSWLTVQFIVFCNK